MRMFKYLEPRDFDRYKASAWALIFSNSLPLFGVLFLGWDAFVVVILYWSENVVIGAINVLKLLTCSPDADHLVWGNVDPNDKLNRERMERSRGKSVNRLRWANHASKLFFVPFFIVHYGIFCLVHGALIFAIFGRDQAGFGPFGGFEGLTHEFSEQHLWWGIAALTGSHLYSYFVNFIGHGEYRRTNVTLLMFQPYARIVVLHIAILLGGFVAFALGSNIFVLIPFIVGKTLLDLSLHLARRAMNTTSTSLESPRGLPEAIMVEAGQTRATPAGAVQSHPPLRLSSGD